MSTMRATAPVVRASAVVRRANVRCQAAPQGVQAQRQARRAMLASVLAVPVLATRPAFAGESELGEVKDLDFRALILSTILMGIAGFTAVGAASTPDSGDAEHH